ncbi:CBS domain-containing protein [Vibrio salinus]|uniref:CBS domain-containing protein n=1 Tax=Vibrio salinus TaxID=2899784 RepID=UPI001E52B4E5|nr:CBS domain-containing protein [Vibrio salinus]MCE0492958.1 CBS domain-containing protein [Vibrio salinus]
MESLKVKDYMIHHPVTFKQNMSLTAALDKVIESESLGGPVVDEVGTLIGFISEHDLLEKLVKVSYICQDSYIVGDCMSTNVVSVHPDMLIIELAEMMKIGKPKVYPVVDDENRLVGLINRRAVLRAINKNLKACFSHQI